MPLWFNFAITFVVVGSCVVQGALAEQSFSNERYRERTFVAVQGCAVAEGIFKTLIVSSELECTFSCLSEDNCKTINYQKAGNPKHLCELSSRTHGQQCKLQRPGYSLFQRVMPLNSSCSSEPCKNGATCVPVVNMPGYQCECNSFNFGVHCEAWTVNVGSCKDIYTQTSYRKNMAYTFEVDTKQSDVYCHMSSICGSGGWTLVMKTDGSKATFAYASGYWSNKLTFNPSAGKTGFDNNETKLSTYWGVSLEKLCVGLKVGNTLRWLSIPFSSSSLYDVIADNTYKSFNVGRNTWLQLIDGSSFQSNCNREGFNSLGRVRIGILANQENDCNSPDSFIGFGSVFSSPCGNICRINCNRGDKVIVAFGYILVK